MRKLSITVTTVQMDDGTWRIHAHTREDNGRDEIMAGTTVYSSQEEADAAAMGSIVIAHNAALEAGAALVSLTITNEQEKAKAEA